MKWISIKEKKPPFDIYVLVTDGTNLGYYRWDTDDIFEDGEGYVAGLPDHTSHEMIGNDITHWFPIPELPAKE